MLFHVGVDEIYLLGKRVAEALAFAYAKQEAVEVRIARIFNTYGPRMHINDGRVVSNFIAQALQGEPLTIYGDGTQTRSFQFITDLVEGLVRLMASNFSAPVNIGNPHEHSVSELAQLIQDLVASLEKTKSAKVSEIVYHDGVQDDPKRRKPDIARARLHLDGWSPKVEISDGLTQTVRYFEAELIHHLAKTRPRDKENLWILTE